MREKAEEAAQELNDFRKKPWEDKKYAFGHWGWSAFEMTVETIAASAIPSAGAVIRMGEVTAERTLAKGAAKAAVKKTAKDVETEVMEHTGEAAARSAAADGSAQQLAKKVRSLEKRREEHIAKLEAYRKNPAAFDNLGYLENAPSQEVRERIINARIRHLEHEIQNFERQITEAQKGTR